MTHDHSAEPIVAAIAAIEDVTSSIETTCAQVGDFLGRGHTTFHDLSNALTAMSLELSGAKTDGASAALQSLSARLNGFAEAAPVESALLDDIGTSVGDSSALLDVLLGHIRTVTIIARSARIEAASLGTHQASFLDFTSEVFDLARGIQTAVKSCARDQVRLATAIDVALQKQRAFEAGYSGELRSVSADLVSVYADIKRRQTQSAQLADSTRSGTMRIATALGGAIVSLQAGDSVRQRLEHVCDALRLAESSGDGIAPSLTSRIGETAQAAPAVCLLQVDHLNRVAPGFNADLSLIRRSLTSLSSDAAGIVAHGRSLVADKDIDTTSSLAIMRQRLTRASILTSACEGARTSVDSALSVVADALVLFRAAVADLADTILDITLVGMNAGLKAGHLGMQGRAFVVIASELKATADRISSAAALLAPKLDQIAGFVNDLKRRRDEGLSAQTADHASSIAHAMDQAEADNGRFEHLMGRMADAGAQFERLLSDAEARLATLVMKTSTLPGAADLLANADGFNVVRPGVDRNSVEPLLDDLFAAYSMEEERDIHRAFLRRHGLDQRDAAAPSASESSDDVLFF